MRVTKYKTAGFSLIELMVSVAIVGILVSVAFPAYQSFIKTGARSAAQADLMSFAAAMERHKAATFSYKGAASGGGNTGAPQVFHAHSPSSEPSTSKKYTLTIDSVTASGTGYVLKASPVSGGSQAGDGAIFFYSDGRKAWDQNNNGSIASSEYCWSC